MEALTVSLLTSERKKEGVMVGSLPALLTQGQTHNGEEDETSNGGFHDGLYISPPGRNILVMVSMLVALTESRHDSRDSSVLTELSVRTLHTLQNIYRYTPPTLHQHSSLLSRKPVQTWLNKEVTAHIVQDKIGFKYFACFNSVVD